MILTMETTTKAIAIKSMWNDGLPHVEINGCPTWCREPKALKYIDVHKKRTLIVYFQCQKPRLYSIQNWAWSIICQRVKQHRQGVGQLTVIADLHNKIKLINTRLQHRTLGWSCIIKGKLYLCKIWIH